MIDARKAYPLYFAIGDAFIRLTRTEPAYALNLLSAVEASIGCGLIVLLAAELTGSIVAGTGAALLFGVSYTFWSQSIIAEVYPLHILFVAATALLLLGWQQRPTLLRLTLFFAVYALGFGNHLSMVLLAPAYVAFLLLAAPGGWRAIFQPRIVLIALACAALGALQYANALRSEWLVPDPPRTIVEGLHRFWFDVTKTDWRDTTVFTVPRSMLSDRTAMYAFDLTQQFGIVGPMLAALGTVRLFFRDWRRCVLIVLLYAANIAFAYGYNVGDSHVFYLPSHLAVALLIASSAVAGLKRFALHGATEGFVLGALLICYAGYRAYYDKPAIDRSHDVRPAEYMKTLTAGIDDQDAILVTQLGWEIQNGLAYFAKEIRPEVVHAWMPEVLDHAPALVRDNTAIGRRVSITANARADLVEAYGPVLTTTIEAPRQEAWFTLNDAVHDLPAGTRYVLCVLKPVHEYAIDHENLDRATATLGAAADPIPIPKTDYAFVAGVTGRPPTVVDGSDRPFRRRVVLDGVAVVIRMDSWLATDTIRRMGFGHVIAARQPTLIVERGVSFVAFGPDGRPVRTAYFGNVFEPVRRYLVHTAPLLP